jgi:predicted  nucleic acid-binding Zn-ribbon protein
MGLYIVSCSTCGDPFQWFSGSIDQRCPNCKPQFAVTPEGEPAVRFYNYWIEAARERDEIAKERDAIRLASREYIAKLERALRDILDEGNLATQGKWNATDKMKRLAYEAVSRVGGGTKDNSPEP